MSQRSELEKNLLGQRYQIKIPESEITTIKNLLAGEIGTPNQRAAVVRIIKQLQVEQGDSHKRAKAVLTNLRSKLNIQL